MATYPLVTRKVTEPAKIGDLQVDVVLSKETTFDSEVSEYPVEDGFPVADHVTRKPMTLTMEVVCTPTPVSWYKTLGVNQNRLDEVQSTIIKMYNEAQPITITTPDAIYREMIMTHAPLPRNVEDGVCYKMQLDFTHVRRVKPKTEEVPEGSAGGDAAGKAGESEKDAGAASQEDIGTGANTETVTIDESFLQEKKKKGGLFSDVGAVLTLGVTLFSGGTKQLTAFAANYALTKIL